MKTLPVLAICLFALGAAGSPLSAQTPPEPPKKSDPLPAPKPAPKPSPTPAPEAAAGTPLAERKLVEVGPLRIPLAAGWVEETPTSRLRAAQAALPAPAAGGPAAELTVYHFGKEQGGDAAANVARWKDQVERPEGLSAEEHAKETRREVAGLPVTMLEMRGRYLGSRFPGQPEPTPIDDARLVGVIIEHPDGNWFIKVAGARATMDHHAKSIEAMIAGIERAAPKSGGPAAPGAPKPLPPGHP